MDIYSGSFGIGKTGGGNCSWPHRELADRYSVDPGTKGAHPPMRSWKLKALAALLAGLLAFTVAGTSGQAVADDAGSNAGGQSGAGSAATALPSPPPKPVAAQPAQDPVEPTDTLLVVGGGLLVIVLAAIGLTITFRSLLGDLRSRRNRYRRRAKREPRSN